MVRVPGRAKPVAASCVAILPRAACWAGLTSMRHTVSDPRFPYLSTVFYWGHVGRQRMPGTGIAGYIAGWQPSSVSPQAAGFARMVVTGAAPGGQERAKNLLWAAGRLADWAIGLGLDPVPEVLLHSSVIERFAAHAPGLTGVTRRTLRTPGCGGTIPGESRRRRRRRQRDGRQRGGGRCLPGQPGYRRDRKSTRLNSSHLGISYAVCCLKKKQDAHNTSTSIFSRRSAFVRLWRRAPR